MESNAALPCSQGPATRPYNKLHKTVHDLTFCIFNMQFNIIPQSTPTPLSQMVSSRDTFE